MRFVGTLLQASRLLVAVGAFVTLGACSAGTDGDVLATAPDPVSAGQREAPVGRSYWSASLGHFVQGQGSWVRNVQYTFNPHSGVMGTVQAVFDQWDGAHGPGRRLAGKTGACNGVPDGCGILEPIPTVSSGALSGTYSLDGGSTATTLHITWTGGSTETWNVEEIRNGTLGRMSLARADWAGSDPNSGVGYGSVQPWSYYKTHGAVDSVDGIFYGHEDVDVGGSVTLGHAWNLDMGGLEAESAGSSTLHHTQSPERSGNPTSCPGDLQSIKGNIYHVLVSNSDRTLVENNYWRCLVQSEVGCYAGGMHIAVLNQVIDDHKNFVGVVGIEASTSGGYTYARIDAIAR